MFMSLGNQILNEKDGSLAMNVLEILDQRPWLLIGSNLRPRRDKKVP